MAALIGTAHDQAQPIRDFAALTITSNPRVTTNTTLTFRAKYKFVWEYNSKNKKLKQFFSIDIYYLPSVSQ